VKSDVPDNIWLDAMFFLQELKDILRKWAIILILKTKSGILLFIWDTYPLVAS